MFFLRLSRLEVQLVSASRAAKPKSCQMKDLACLALRTGVDHKKPAKGTMRHVYSYFATRYFPVSRPLARDCTPMVFGPRLPMATGGLISTAGHRPRTS